VAIKLFDAVGYLRTDASAMKRGLEKARRGAFTIAGNIGKIFAKLAKTAVKAFAAIGAAMLGAVVTGLVQFAKLEKGLAEIMTLFGDIGADAPALRDELEGIVQTLMTQFGQTLPESIKATYDAVSAGIKKADIGKFMKDAAKLAIAGVTDIGRSVDVLTSLINSYGLSARDAEHVSDLLFTTVKLGKTTMEELSQSMGQIAPIAAGAKVPLSEMLSAMAVLTSRGLSTAEATTALKAAIQSMLKPTGEASELAEKLGIDFSAQALATKGLSGMMELLQKATKGDAEQMATLLGSVRGLNAAMILTSETGSTAFSNAMGEMTRAGGATQEAFDKMADTISFQWDRIVGATKVAFAAIGSIFGDTFKEFLKVTNKWVDDNSALFERFRVAAKEKMDTIGIALLARYREVLPQITAWIRQTTTGMEDWKLSVGDVQRAIDNFNAGNFMIAINTILGAVSDLAAALQRIIGWVEALGYAAGWVYSFPTRFGTVERGERPLPDDPSERRGGGSQVTNHNRFDAVEIRIDGSDLEAESIAKAVGEALLDLGRAGALTRGGIAVTP
jgi:TP901 family phage tail tape measure protein